MSYKFEDVVIDNKLISLLASKDDVSIETIRFLSCAIGKKIISVDIVNYLDALKYLEIDDELHIFVNYNNNSYRHSFKHINNILTAEQLVYCCNKNKKFAIDCCENYEAMKRIYDYDKQFFNTLVEYYPSHFVKILNLFNNKLTSEQINNVVTNAIKCNVIEYANNFVDDNYIITNCFNGNLQKVLEHCKERVPNNIIDKLKAYKDNTKLLIKYLPHLYSSDDRLKFVDENIEYCNILNLEELKVLSNNFSSDTKYFGKELRVFERINKLTIEETKRKNKIKNKPLIQRILNFIMRR